MLKHLNLTYFGLQVYNHILSLFGLMPFHLSKTGQFKKLKWQRLKASIALLAYYLILFSVDHINLGNEMSLKNFMVFNIMPKITVIFLTLAMTATYICTHVFAKQRKTVLKSFKQIYEVLNSICHQNDIFRLDYSTVATVGSLLIMFNVYTWYIMLMIMFVRNDLQPSLVSLVLLAFPVFVNATFQMEYTIMMANLRNLFNRLNNILIGMQAYSFESAKYPSNERTFQEHVTIVTDQHKKLTEAAEKLNSMYSLQISLNISVLFGAILCDSYISVFLFLSTTFNRRLVTIVHAVPGLVLHCLMLLSFVEVAWRACKAVSTKCSPLFSDISINVIRQFINSGATEKKYTGFRKMSHET